MRIRTRGLGGVASPSSFMYSSKPWLSVRRHFPSRSLRLAMAGGRAGEHESSSSSSSGETRWRGRCAAPGATAAYIAMVWGGVGQPIGGAPRPGHAPSPRPGPMRPGPCRGSEGATLAAPARLGGRAAPAAPASRDWPGAPYSSPSDSSGTVPRVRAPRKHPTTTHSLDPTGLRAVVPPPCRRPARQELMSQRLALWALIGRSMS